MVPAKIGDADMTDQYIKVSPRGFANETYIFRVKAEDVATAEAEFAGYEDDVERGGYTAWVKGPFLPGQLIDWADRHMVL